MYKGIIFFKRFKADPVTHLVSILALIVGILFIIMQGCKLLRPETAMNNLPDLPIGKFDLGFALADIIIPGPLLVTGALCLLYGKYLIGHLLIFAGWAINFYGMVVFFAGCQALGRPLAGGVLFEVIITAFLSLFCMTWSILKTLSRRI